jgi:H+/gluconate symporter-like permease
MAVPAPANIPIARPGAAADVITAGMVIAVVIPIVGGVIAGVRRAGDRAIPKASGRTQNDSKQTDCDEVFHRSSKQDPAID